MTGFPIFTNFIKIEKKKLEKLRNKENIFLLNWPMNGTVNVFLTLSEYIENICANCYVIDTSVLNSKMNFLTLLYPLALLVIMRLLLHCSTSLYFMALWITNKEVEIEKRKQKKNQNEKLILCYTSE